MTTPHKEYMKKNNIKSAIIYRLFIVKDEKRYYYIDWCRNEKSMEKILKKHNDYYNDYKTHMLYDYEDYNENDEVFITSCYEINYVKLKELHKKVKEVRHMYHNKPFSLGEVHIQEDLEYDKIFSELGFK
jgi:hypothetical protein